MTPKLRVEFAPGCFDDFDGTQEELDQLMAEILRMAESGELEHLNELVDLEDLEPEQQDLIQRLAQTDPERVLH